MSGKLDRVLKWIVTFALMLLFGLFAEYLAGSLGMTYGAHATASTRYATAVYQAIPGIPPRYTIKNHNLLCSLRNDYISKTN